MDILLFANLFYLVDTVKVRFLPVAALIIWAVGETAIDRGIFIMCIFICEKTTGKRIVGIEPDIVGIQTFVKFPFRIPAQWIVKSFIYRRQDPPAFLAYMVYIGNQPGREIAESQFFESTFLVNSLQASKADSTGVFLSGKWR